jgi:hypothetical protein
LSVEAGASAHRVNGDGVPARNSSFIWRARNTVTRLEREQVLTKYVKRRTFLIGVLGL